MPAPLPILGERPLQVIVTGASDGIGLRLANQYCARGARVVALGRRKRHEIEPMLVKEIRYISLDFTDADLKQKVAHLIAAIGWQHLDILVHCAGVGMSGPIEDTTPDELVDLLHINFTVPLLLTHRLARHLAHSTGRVIFIGSTSHRSRHSNFSAYSASKAALHGAAKSLALEWRGKIKVMIVHPGPTSTTMHLKIGFSPGPVQCFFAKPADMASEILDATTRNQTVVSLGLAVLAKLWVLNQVRWLGFCVRGIRAK